MMSEEGMKLAAIDCPVCGARPGGQISVGPDDKKRMRAWCGLWCPTSGCERAGIALIHKTPEIAVGIWNGRSL